jgi:hypothetical protein
MAPAHSTISGYCGQAPNMNIGKVRAHHIAP